MRANPAPGPWLTFEQLAERWQVTPDSLRKSRNRGRAPKGVKLGRGLRFRIEDIEEYEQQQREAAT